MPKNTQSTSKRTAIIVAVIGALGAIVSAIIVSQYSQPKKSLEEKIVYSVQVREETTNDPVSQVAVTLMAGELVPPVQYTNSQGLVRIEIPKSKDRTEGRIYIKKDGYTGLNDRIVLLSDGKIDEFILKPQNAK